MKNLLDKFMPLFDKLKGKKKMVIILSSVVIVALYLGVHFGYISEDIINFDTIISSVENLTGSSSVDTLQTPVVDTIQVVKDSL